MIDKIKKLFKKEPLFSCIVWDKKCIKYLDLNQKQIDEINNSPKYEGWSATKKDDLK